MSVFIPTNGPDSTAQDVPNIPFFPPFSTADLRTSMRIMDAIPTDRLFGELQRAVLATNRELHYWRIAQEESGHATLADISADTYGEETELSIHYRQAAFHRAKAFLIEKSTDFDSTGEGSAQGKDMEPNVEDHFRIVREEIAAILSYGTTSQSQNGTIVELL
ncbi:MAG: head completion/stabilization protein [Parvibaculaceae bacterium]|nr:head completion/stabilization protein [Parvibaculaceae bacterium]